MVVEHSRNDIDALVSLSLVSKSLRSRAVEFLFDRVTLSTVHTHYRWLQFIEAFPHIAIPYLRCLIIESGRDDAVSGTSNQLWGDSTPYTPRRILDEPPVDVLLPNPPINRVDTLIWTPTQPPNQHTFPTVVHILSSLDSLKNLHIIQCRFTSTQQLQTFLSNCGQIEFLELHDVTIEGASRAEDAEPVLAYDLSQLQELRINSTSPADWVVDHIMSRSRPIALHYLSIESPACFTAGAFEHLLQIVEGSLTHLVVVAEAIRQQGTLFLFLRCIAQFHSHFHRSGNDRGTYGRAIHPTSHYRILVRRQDGAPAVVFHFHWRLPARPWPLRTHIHSRNHFNTSA